MPFVDRQRLGADLVKLNAKPGVRPGRGLPERREDIARQVQRCGKGSRSSCRAATMRRWCSTGPVHGNHHVPGPLSGFRCCSKSPAAARRPSPPRPPAGAEPKGAPRSDPLTRRSHPCRPSDPDRPAERRPRRARPRLGPACVALTARRRDRRSALALAAAAASGGADRPADWLDGEASSTGPSAATLRPDGPRRRSSSPSSSAACGRGSGWGLHHLFATVPYGMAARSGCWSRCMLAGRSLYGHVGRRRRRAARPAARRPGAPPCATSSAATRTSLDRHGVARAAVESLAENFADGLVAPAFWYLLLGLPGLLAYKAVNTARLHDRLSSSARLIAPSASSRPGSTTRRITCPRGCPDC
jgi:hypothetical protein